MSGVLCQTFVTLISSIKKGKNEKANFFEKVFKLVLDYVQNLDILTLRRDRT